jgi:hypothetical protein
MTTTKTLREQAVSNTQATNRDACQYSLICREQLAVCSRQDSSSSLILVDDKNRVQQHARQRRGITRKQTRAAQTVVSRRERVKDNYWFVAPCIGVTLPPREEFAMRARARGVIANKQRTRAVHLFICGAVIRDRETIYYRKEVFFVRLRVYRSSITVY